MLLAVLGWGQGREVLGQPFAVHPLLNGGGDAELSLDLYLPEGEGPFPVVVLLHGGSYVTGRRQDGAPLAREFVRRGVAVVTPDLRLGFVADAGSETEAASAGMDDVNAAFEWVAQHATKYGLDSGRVFVGGWSSGGHLALAVGTLYPLLSEHPVTLRGVLDFFGGYFEEFLGDWTTPVLLLQGTLDQACLPAASRRMALNLTWARSWNRLVVAEGMYHSWEGRWKSDLVGWCVEFIEAAQPGKSLPEGGEWYAAAPGAILTRK